MNSRRSLVSFGLLAYLFFLLWQLPAARSYSLAQRFLPAALAPLHLRELQGTWREGVARDGQWQALRVEEFQWRLKPWSLLAGQLAVAFKSRGPAGTLAATVSKGINSLAVEELESQLELAALAPLFLPGVKVEGVVVGQGGLRIRHGRLTAATGKLLWQEAGLAVLQPLSLGDLRADLSTGPEGVRVALADGGGPLQATGTALIQGDGQYSLTVSLAARQELLQKQLDTLAAWGKKLADDRLQFERNGVLPLLPL